MAHEVGDVYFYSNTDGFVRCVCEEKFDTIGAFYAHRREAGQSKGMFSNLRKPSGIEEAGPTWLRQARAKGTAASIRSKRKAKTPLA